MREDVQVLGGGEVLLSGSAVLWVATALERAAQAQRANGLRDGDIGRLADSFAFAAQRVRSSGVGTSEVPMAPVLPSSMPVDPVTSSKAAEMLSCGSRYVTELCNTGAFDGPVKQVCRRWLIERAAVLARIERKAN
jgi:hypothetical protein